MHITSTFESAMVEECAQTIYSQNSGDSQLATAAACSPEPSMRDGSHGISDA